MKKILFLLVLIYNYSNAYIYSSSEFVQALSNLTCSTNSGSGASSSSRSDLCNMNYQKTTYSDSTDGFTRGSDSYAWFSSADGYNYCRVKTVYTNYTQCVNKPLPDSPSGACQGKSIQNISGEIYSCNSDDGSLNLIPNPDPLQDGGQCRDLFQKDGKAYTCNPNTNEASEIPYSDGTTFDPDNNEDIPKCSEGYSATNQIFMSVGDSSSPYKSWSCSKNVTNPDGSVTGDNGVVIGADGSITTPNPNGGSTTVYVDGSTKTIAPDGTITTTPAPNSTGGTTGGDTGTTGGTTGGGTGTTGGDGSVTVVNPDGSTTTTFPDGTITTTPAPNSTGGTTGGDTGTGGGTGTTGGTTGTDSGTGTTGGTGNNTGTTDPTTGAGDCNDSNMTLTEKTLCKISNIFTPAGTAPTSNPLASSSTLIDGVTSEYSTFKTNISNQGDTLKSLVYTSIDTVNQGFSFNISSNDVVSCPKDYTLDLSALNMANMNVVLDICLQTSKLKPYFYPLFLIMLSVGTTLITFRMLGVLI